MTRNAYIIAMAQVDDAFGAVVACARSHLGDNIFILYSSDNGGAVKGVVDYNGARNWPFRGAKHQILEGGIRVSSFFWMGSPAWSRVFSARYAPLKTSARYAGLLHFVDWVPSLAALAEVPHDAAPSLAGSSSLSFPPSAASPSSGFSSEFSSGSPSGCSLRAVGAVGAVGGRESSDEPCACISCL